MKQATFEEIDTDESGRLRAKELHEQIRVVGQKMGEDESLTEAFEKYGDAWKEEGSA